MTASTARAGMLVLAMTVLTACVASGPTATAPDAQAGRDLFFAQCARCHTLGVPGTPIAPDLSTIGARLTREEIEARLRDPRTHQPSARMPKLDLRDKEIRVLARYLSELR